MSGVKKNHLVISAVIITAAYGAAWGARTSPLAPTRTIPVRDAAGTEYPLAVDDRGATFVISAPARSSVDVAPGTSISSALHPSFAAAEGNVLPSLELCRWKGLAFEEGALAAVEAKLDDPAGGLAALPSGRLGFLGALASKLKQAYDAQERPAAREPFGNALAFVATGMALARPDGKVPPELGLPADLVTKANQDREDFLKADALARSPAGRYAWDENLTRLYVAGRWLARDFAASDAAAFQTAVALAWTVSADPELARAYKFLVDTYKSLVGWPPGRATVADYNGLLGGRDAPTVFKEVGTVRTMQDTARGKGAAFVFLPAVSEPEVEFVRRVVAGGAKTDAGWAEALVAGIPAGAAPKPAADGSWCDYAGYAWAALVPAPDAPDAKKLLWDDNYKKRLGESYRFAFDQVRTRAAPPPPKTGLGGLEADVVPEFRLEPLPEYYLRMARAYARLEIALSAALTPAGLGGVRGRREKGTAADPSLAAEAAATRDLFYGFYLLSCSDVGAPAAAGGEVADRAAAATRAAEWLTNWRADPDMGADVRTAWPLGPADAADPKKGTVYRCVLGVRAVDLEVKYEGKPGTVLSGTSKTVSLHVKPVKYTVLVPVVVEVTVAGEKPLTQTEFRKICDQNKARDEIVAALKEFGKPPPPPPPPPPKPKRKYDRGMVVLVGILALFMLIVLIAIIAGRRRSYY